MTLQEMINITPQQLYNQPVENLIKIAREAARKSRQRADSIEKHNLEEFSRPYKTWKRSGGAHFNLKDIRLNNDGTYNRFDLRDFIFNQQEFLRSQTGTYKGWSDWYENTMRSFGTEHRTWYEGGTFEKRTIIDLDGNIVDQSRFDIEEIERRIERGEFIVTDVQEIEYKGLSIEDKREYWKLFQELQDSQAPNQSYRSEVWRIATAEILMEDGSDLYTHDELLDKMRERAAEIQLRNQRTHSGNIRRFSVW